MWRAAAGNNMKQDNLAIDELLTSRLDTIVTEWLAEFNSGAAGRRDAGSSGVASEAREIAQAFHAGIRADGDSSSFNGAAWQTLRDLLDSLSRSRAAQGATAADTNAFLLAFKKPLFSGLQASQAAAPARMAGALWAVSTLVDKMAEHTLAVYQRTREDIISRQQQELLELSTPVVKLWEGVLAVPMIGTLDSGRTQLVMESLLQRIVDTGSELAIIDITGVPTVDTLVAQHLLKTVTAIRLMGADCIISGIRPQIAQTIVHLGIDLQGITTKATLADALALAMKRSGYVVSRPLKA
jgi:rsbT co-antagonist protein RsbR